MLPSYRPRRKTSAVLLHASHTPPSRSHLEHFLAVQGRTMGLLSIGYHFLILQEGRLIECRPHTAMGAHCKGLDRETIGVCLAGGVGEDRAPVCVSGHDRCHEGAFEGCPYCEHRDEPEANFTRAQGETLRFLMDYLRTAYCNPLLPLRGHYEERPHRARQCPPMDMDEVRRWVG